MSLRSIITFLVLVALSASVSQAQATVRTARPSLPAPQAGAPGGNSWVSGGLVRAYEDDGLTGDDFLGNATVGSGGASAHIRLTAREIMLLRDEWFEGDCLEIEFFWEYWTWVPYEYPRATPTGYVIIRAWRRVKKTVGTDPIVICP